MKKMLSNFSEGMLEDMKIMIRCNKLIFKRIYIVIDVECRDQDIINITRLGKFQQATGTNQDVVLKTNRNEINKIKKID